MSKKDHLAELRNKKEAHREGNATGCVWRSCRLNGHNYYQNARDYIKANQRKVYEIDFTVDPDRSLLHRITRIYGKYRRHRSPDTQQNLWWFGKGSNFENGNWPWTNQYHHILPVESLREGARTAEAIELLLRANYSINDGVNIIILPCFERDSLVMRLPTHNGSHPQYNGHVKEIVNKVAAKLQKATDPKEPHPTPEEVKGIKDELDQWSRDEFDQIVKWGRDFPGMKINDKPEDYFAGPPRG